MKPSLILASLFALPLALPLAACDQGDTDLGELETESSSTSGGPATQTSDASATQTSGASGSMTSGVETSGASETGGSSSSGDSLYPAACEAAGWVESYEAWQAVAAGGSYTYVAQDTVFIGLGEFQCQHNTTVTVVAGEVVGREFELIEQAEGADCEEDFVETSKNLGANDVPGAHPPVTMDEVYLTCCENQLDLPAEDWTSTFMVDDAGLFAHCSTRMTDCDDGCNQGGAGEASIIEYSF